MNNDHELTLIPGLYDDEFFEFEAASGPIHLNEYHASVFNDTLNFQAFSSSLPGNQPALTYYPPTNSNNNISQTSAVRNGEELHTMPLTNSEIKSILAMGASKDITWKQAAAEGSFHPDNQIPAHAQMDREFKLMKGDLNSGK